jgi:hypothetical protein
MQPGAKWTCSIVVVNTLQCANESVGHHILGDIPITGDAVGDAKRMRLMQHDERCKRSRVAAGECRDGR